MTPEKWLRLARGDLLLTHADVPGAPLELFCFHAQQAAEKSIKAVLLEAAIPFPHTHDLDRLLDLLDEHGVPLPAEVRKAGSLTGYSVATRYPLPSEPVSPDELMQAIECAEYHLPVGASADPAHLGGRHP